jgi:hypothetical protein
MQVIAGINGTTSVRIFQLHIEEKADGLIDGPRLVSGFLKISNFFSARIADVEFEYWENADQICLYEWKGRSHLGKKLVSNGLPFPLEEMVVDTSDNPGRRLFVPGYIEAVGHEMWLSPEFLAQIGTPRLQHLEEAGWRVEVLEGGLLHLGASPSPFFEGGSRERQERLRNALFLDSQKL